MTNQPAPRFFDTAVVGGLTAGILDGLDAVVFFGLAAGAAPGRIFQGIAYGLLGKASFQGGTPTVLLGVFLQLFNGVMAGAVYYTGARLFPAVLRRPFVWGPLYGIGVFAFMYRVVIPLSRIGNHTRPMGLVEFLDELFAHTVLVGLPIALRASKSAARREALAEAA